jgi:pimeloyl-ACP methyl ester carboxylesterase
MDELVFVPPWAKQEHYGRLTDAFADLGYRIDPPAGDDGAGPACYTFPYDWRQDNRLSARQLGEAVERWSERHPGAEAWIVAHSNGGVVARWYIEQEGGKDRVGRLVLLASPWDGTPKAMYMLFQGFDTMLRRRFNAFDLPERSRDMLRSYASLYQLLPAEDGFLVGRDGRAVDVFEGTWLASDEQRGFLTDARDFSRQLGDANSVDTLCIFGRKQATLTGGTVETDASGAWSGIAWQSTGLGDGTLPEESAVHPTARSQLPFPAGHGDIYVAPPVLSILEWELVDKYLPPEQRRRATVITPKLSVTFEPTDDVVEPGQPVSLWATVHDREGRPVSGATVAVTTAWREALPGSAVAVAPSAGAPAELEESDEEPGRYEGSVVAPAVEGYYELAATVQPPSQLPVRLSELIAVEAAE